MMEQVQHAGYSYTLYTRKELPRGTYVLLNASSDTYGIVLDSKQLFDGRWNTFVRGTPRRGAQQPELIA